MDLSRFELFMILIFLGRHHLRGPMQVLRGILGINSRTITMFSIQKSFLMNHLPPSFPFMKKGLEEYLKSKNSKNSKWPGKCRFILYGGRIQHLDLEKEDLMRLSSCQVLEIGARASGKDEKQLERI